MGGVIHPFIHTGFGLEFRDRIVLAEGKVFLDLTVVLLTQRRLAEAAIHKTEILSKLFPSDWPRSILTDPSPSQAQRSASSRSDKWAESTYPRLPVSGKSLLEIYSDFCQNPKIKPVPYDPDMLINDRLKGCLKDGGAESLFALGEEWSLTDEEVSDGSDGWTRKLEEVAVLGTLLACATGRKGKDKKVDFFLVCPVPGSNTKETKADTSDARFDIFDFPPLLYADTIHTGTTGYSHLLSSRPSTHIPFAWSTSPGHRFAHVIFSPPGRAREQLPTRPVSRCIEQSQQRRHQKRSVEHCGKFPVFSRHVHRFPFSWLRLTENRLART